MCDSFATLKQLLGCDQLQVFHPVATGVSLSLFDVWGAELAPADLDASVAVQGSEPHPDPEEV